MKKNVRTRLVLIPGGGGVQGPIDRLALWSRFPEFKRPQVAVWIATKLLVLAAAAYLIWG